MGNQQKRRHHFIPKSYLNRFATKNDGQFFVFDLAKKHKFQTSPDNIAHMRDFYTLEIEDSKTNEVEDYFSIVEGGAKSIFDEWIKTMKKPAKKDWAFISEFIAGLSVRVPEFRKKSLEQAQYMFDLYSHFQFSNEQSFKDFCGRYYKETGETINISYQEARSLIDNPTGLHMTIHQNEYIVTMLQMIPQLSNIICTMKPYLLISTGKARFVTSDNPVILYDTLKDKPKFYGTGWLTKTVNVYIPLSPYTCLVLCWDGEYNALPVDDYVVSFANCLQSFYSTRYVLSSTESIYWRKGNKIYNNDDTLFDEFSELKSKPSTKVSGPVSQIERPFDLSMIKKTAYRK